MVAVAIGSCASLLPLPVVGAPAAPDKSATSDSGASSEKGVKSEKDTKAAPAEVPPKTKMALKLAGLVTFVASSCPDLRPDYAKFKGAVGALGVAVADLDKMELKTTYLSYAMRYKEDVAKNCARAFKDFGPGGTVVPDLVNANIKTIK